jgi:deazaflavin-dependent oxidoreductase (nitroreductase family)
MTIVEHIATFLTRKKWNPRVIRAGSRFHKLLFHRLGLGRFRLIGQDSLVLTTHGRKTGRETSTPLFYTADGDRLYVAASFAGSGTPPNWYLNLVAHPEVTVETRRSRRRYRARTLDAGDAARLWPKLDAIYPTFAKYRKRTSRVLPVVELSLVSVSGSADEAAPPSAA